MWSVLLAPYLFPSLWSLGLLVTAVASGRVVIGLLPALEGLDDDLFLDLEPASWEDLNEDLLGWVKSQSPSAGVGTAPGRCTSCDSHARAQANGRVGPRVLDEALSSMVAYSGRLDEPAPHNDGYQDPFLAHPEGPSLSRRVALEELAWALTQLAGEVGMGAAEAARCRPLPTYKNRWEEFKVDMAREIRSAMRREVSFSDHGHPEVLVSLPFVLPTAIKLRRRCSQRRTYGPLAAFWWPYRYSGGPLRDVALETAVVVIIVGSAMVAWGVTTYGLTSALW